MASVKPVPEGYHTVTPYLYIKGAAKAIEFYKAAFGATELVRMPGPKGEVMHAEIKIGDSIVMLSEENPRAGALSPQPGGGPGARLYIYLPDVDAVAQKAVEAGAHLAQPVKDQFYGDRSGMLLDPFGYVWWVATHVEDVSPEEMRKRMAKLAQAAGA